MMKIKEKGIKGRIRCWIKYFLSDRSANITMSGVTGQTSDSLRVR